MQQADDIRATLSLHIQVSRFCEDPAGWLNTNERNVRQLRVSMPGPSAGDLGHGFWRPGSVPLWYLPPSNARRQVFLGIADSALWVTSSPSGPYVQKQAYYLPWKENAALAVELGSAADLFFTAELTGCGLIFLSAPGETIVVHHNIQVDFSVPQDCSLKELMQLREQNRPHQYATRMQALYDLTQHILDGHPGVARGKLLNVHHYGDQARVFGVRGLGGWRLYINRFVEGSFRTELLYR